MYFVLRLQGRILYLDDGVSRIDYVLAWEVPKKETEDTEKARKAREIFEKNLVDEGLVLEYDTTVGDHYWQSVCLSETLTFFSF